MHLRPHCARLAGCDIEPLMVAYGPRLCLGVEFHRLADLALCRRDFEVEPVALFNHAFLLTRR